MLNYTVSRPEIRRMVLDAILVCDGRFRLPRTPEEDVDVDVFAKDLDSSQSLLTISP